jgi:transposase
LEEQLKFTHVLQADETPVKVLDDNIRGYMWGCHSCEPKNKFILFKYSDSRSGKVASDILRDYTGILQSDGYSGYNELRFRDTVINIGCWAHCRRNFVDVIKIASTPGKAQEIVKLINELYHIETTARNQNLDFSERQKLRQKEAVPILEKIHESLTKANAPPKSSLGKAITYALNQWQYLKKYTDHGEAEIDNNLIENQIRPFALGRRNWLFLGNEKAANTAAFFCSIIQTCRINNIDARKYLIYVLTQAGEMRRGRINPKILLPQFIDINFP